MSRDIPLDSFSTLKIIKKLYQSQRKGVSYLIKNLPELEIAVEECVPLLENGGRLIFVGAGTSGRLGGLEASELWPTFSWPKEKTVVLMAGGEKAFFQSVEGAEDDTEAAKIQARSVEFSKNDVVIALAASGETPYTTTIAKLAHELGLKTIGIACKANSTLLQICKYKIYIPIEQEAIQGSTRLSCGTAQKIILNLLTTSFMIRLHRIYNSYMVDVKVTNKKLYKRAVQMVCEISSVDEKTAEHALFECNNEVKLACALIKFGNIEIARSQLEKSKGDLRSCLEQKTLRRT